MNSLSRRIAASSSRSTSRLPQKCTTRTRYNVSRELHTKKPLPYKVEDGLGHFLPPQALRTIEEWQEGLLERLNVEVKGTQHENKSVVQTMIDTAADRSKTLAFNYASQALNNSFFLERLKPPIAPSENHEERISGGIGSSIRTEFGSLTQLKSTFSAAALGMMSSGWVWLVADSKANLAVIPTFGAGSLLVRSRAQTRSDTFHVVGEEDKRVQAWMNSVRSSTSSSTAVPPTVTEDPAPLSSQSRQPAAPPASPASGVRPSSTGSSSFLPPLSRELHATRSTQITDRAASIFDDDAAEPSIIPTRDDDLRLGDSLYPLFCISVHEHAWMSAGYGVWGKEEYLKRFWTCVDWATVSDDFTKLAKPAKYVGP
ncbi:manganese and iron superoxide dismutase [Rickenella mellea]|uniref:Manganese and iron superoxide dismutase n=1 Tax=Rickenella mellea TaxID=50990 RepID=A0A4R5XGQ0_9AGAM|nr:manganese and iron superoxide dismutase [Rickenella mellea]